jgi:hypothetical protein
VFDKKQPIQNIVEPKEGNNYREASMEAIDELE